jgi:hypothetical protein
MRVLFGILALTVIVVASRAHLAEAADGPEWADPDRPIAQQLQEVDDNDDTRVEVQLVVLGAVVGTVFVVGTGLYFLRKRLGLVAPPPEQDAGSHH